MIALIRIHATVAQLVKKLIRNQTFSNENLSRWRTRWSQKTEHLTTLKSGEVHIVIFLDFSTSKAILHMRKAEILSGTRLEGL